MKRLIQLLLLMGVVSAGAEELGPADSQLIEDAGIPLFPEASFVTGNKEIGFRFVTADGPEAVRGWYQDRLPAWSLFDEFGGWMLYNGDPGLGMGEVMSKNQIMVDHNDDLPEWHGLDETMTTEIVIMIVE